MALLQRSDLFRRFSVKNNNTITDDGTKILWDKSTNLLHRKIVNKLPLLEKGKAVSLPSNIHHAKPQNFIYSKHDPLLVEQYDHLQDLWKNFQPYDIVTNRRTLRKLAAGSPEEKYTIREIVKDGKPFVVLHHVQEDYVQKIIPDLYRAYKTVLESSERVEYSDYAYDSFLMNNGLRVHYSSEIDAFAEGFPYEIKMIHKEGCKLDRDKAFDAALQCKLAYVDRILVGSYNANAVNMKLYFLEKGAEKLKFNRKKLHIALQDTLVTALEHIVRYSEKIPLTEDFREVKISENGVETI